MNAPASAERRQKPRRCAYEMQPNSHRQRLSMFSECKQKMLKMKILRIHAIAQIRISCSEICIYAQSEMRTHQTKRKK